MLLQNCNIFERKNIVPVGFFLLLHMSQPFDEPESGVLLTYSAEPAVKEVASELEIMYGLFWGREEIILFYFDLKIILF